MWSLVGGQPLELLLPVPGTLKSVANRTERIGPGARANAPSVASAPLTGWALAM